LKRAKSVSWTAKRRSQPCAFHVQEISYGQDIHRRVGAIGLAVASLGNGALMALTKSKTQESNPTQSTDCAFYVERIFPNPLTQNSSGQWAFNTAAGKDEVLARRIGDGELTAIGVLTEIANAQQEYFSQTHQYAQKFVSDEDQHNGLYWPTAEGQRPSPLGPLADMAKAVGYSQASKDQAFNGYYYNILTRQGDAAKGGAKNYMVEGKMTSGFAVVAWPAKYRDSGIKTFVVGKDGTIYEKDLGGNTSNAGAITAYNPGDGWTVVLAPESPNAPVGSPSAKQ
jgi:hypothetical protein